METRTKILKIRVSPAELEALEQITEHERRNSSSEAVRELIRATAKAYGLWPPPAPETRTEKHLGQLPTAKARGLEGSRKPIGERRRKG